MNAKDAETAVKEARLEALDVSMQHLKGMQHALQLLQSGVSYVALHNFVERRIAKDCDRIKSINANMPMGFREGAD